jgi:lysophospholipase L1-like esterase
MAQSTQAQMLNEFYEIGSYVGTGTIRFGMVPAQTHEILNPDFMVRFWRFAGPRAFPMIRCAAAVASFCCLASLSAAADPSAPGAVVVGDSHGASIAQVSGLKGLARNSVHIRGPKAVQQINSVPPQSTALVVLGSNDAEFSIKGLDPYINAILDAASRRSIRLVWIGPPCTSKAWNSRVRELDAMLAARFVDTAVTYVSVLDPKICAGGYYDGDGVHFTMKGYGYMWEKARTAAGFETPAEQKAPGAPSGLAAAAADEAGTASQPHKLHRRHVRHVTRLAIPAMGDGLAVRRSGAL